MSDQTRKGEDAPHPFRSNRIFNVNGAWYFSTREGEDIGPFPDRAETEAALIEYLRQRALEDQQIAAS